jgi:hypothetical protein
MSLDADIHALLDTVKAADEAVQEFAWLQLHQYKREALAEPTRERMEEARLRLRQRLRNLLAWAKATGRC